jgi:uncharacterized membrane protein YkvA (DUF1232 family)
MSNQHNKLPTVKPAQDTFEAQPASTAQTQASTRPSPASPSTGSQAGFTQQLETWFEGVRGKLEDPRFTEEIRVGFDAAVSRLRDRLGARWDDAQTLYRMVFDDQFQMTDQSKWVALGALAYVVSPLDLVPELILGPLGLVDDVAVVNYALEDLAPELARYRRAVAERTVSGGEHPRGRA